MFKNLYNDLINHKTKLSLIGLGYVGMPIAAEFSKKGIDVIGFDLNEEKVNMINKRISPIRDKDIEEYFKNSDAKTALLAAKWLGNNETHYVNNNDEKCIQLLENLIEDTIYHIHRELREKKAIQINANKGKIFGLF